MHRLLPVLLVVFLSCATPRARLGTSTYDVVQPEVYEVTNEIYLDRPFDDVWDDLVGNLAKSFYVINNIEKESRLINISFSSDRPQDYVDCGTSVRTYERGSEQQQYTYEIAGSSSYKYAGVIRGKPVTCYIDRQVELDGRANIYVAPEGSGTRISVNARYILTIQAGGTYVAENAFGMPIESGDITVQSVTVSLNTGEAKEANLGTQVDPVYVTCYSRGRLENDILSFVRGE